VEIEIGPGSAGLVVAPAGHGKTHLIADRVTAAARDERLLVMTHTNVAVRALRKKFSRPLQAPVSIGTLDALALRIASAFPSAAGFDPTEAPLDWAAARAGAIKALQKHAIRCALHDSYTAVIVDEYQDCSEHQVALVRILAEVIPTVVLGDPMQSVYRFGTGYSSTWEEQADGYPVLGELRTPWRWRNAPELGAWIVASRNRLQEEHAVTLGPSSPVSAHRLSAPASQGGLRRLLGDLVGSVAVISGESRNKHRLRDIARSHRWSNCEVFETAAPEELDSLASGYLADQPAPKALALLEFSKQCMSKVGDVTGVGAVTRNLTNSGQTGNSRAPIAAAMKAFISTPTGLSAQEVLRVLAGDAATYVFRPQLLSVAQRAHGRVGTDGLENFPDALLATLEARKHVDEKVRGPVVGTALRLKGLEFDNVVIVDPDRFETAEQTYVAISRPAGTCILATEPDQSLGSRFALINTAQS